MSDRLKKSPLIWKSLSLMLLFTLAACQFMTPSTLPDQTDTPPGSTSEVMPTTTLQPSTETQAPTETNAPTDTQALTETPEPTYQVLTANAMDPSVSLEWVRNPMWEPFYDFPLGNGFTLFIPPGFVIAYEYGKTGDEQVLYLLYVSPAGIVNAQVDTLINNQSGIVKSVQHMSEEEMQSFMDAFDAYFLAAEENGFVPYVLSLDVTIFGAVFIESEAGASSCLSHWKIEEPVGALCAFDPQADTLSSQETMGTLIQAYTPLGDRSLAEILDGEYDVYSPENNTCLFFQFSP